MGKGYMDKDNMDQKDKKRCTRWYMEKTSQHKVIHGKRLYMEVIHGA